MVSKFVYNIPFGYLAIICYIFTIITAWSYGNSYAYYVVVSVVMAIFAYGAFFSNRNQINRNIKQIITLVLFGSLAMGLINGDVKSSIMVNISLLMPISLSTLSISYDNIQKQLLYASIVNLGLILLIGRNFASWNSNSLAFVIFCGVSIGMMWFKTAEGFKQLVCSSVYLMFATTLLLAAGSRNAGIVIIICYVMLLVPKRIYSDLSLFRITYITALLLTVFSVDFQMYILNDAQIMDNLQAYTTSFSNKAWGMDTHYILLKAVTSKFSSLDLFTQLFGTGVKAAHCHNLFYQCLFFYGYVGTTLIYLFYMYVFETAYKLIHYNNDIIVLSCFIILIGHFLLQIGEVYMLGAETANVMSLLPAGIILQRWNQYLQNLSIQ